jgi:hypothetical protein
MISQRPFDCVYIQARFLMCTGLMDDNVNENEPLVIAVAPFSSSNTKSSCSFSTMIYVLIPTCVIVDLLAIWYRQTILYLVAVCISILFCCKSSCWASVLVVLQCFVGIYYHVFVMNGFHASLKVGGFKL